MTWTLVKAVGLALMALPFGLMFLALAWLLGVKLAAAVFVAGSVAVALIVCGAVLLGGDR